MVAGVGDEDNNRVLQVVQHRSKTATTATRHPTNQHKRSRENKSRRMCSGAKLLVAVCLLELFCASLLLVQGRH
jgi:hypothetical protein